MLAPSGRSLNSPLRGSDNGTGHLPRALRFSASPTGITVNKRATLRYAMLFVRNGSLSRCGGGILFLGWFPLPERDRQRGCRRI